MAINVNFMVALEEKVRGSPISLGFIYWGPWVSILNFVQIHMDFYWISGILTYCWPLTKRKGIKPLGFILWRPWMHGNPKVEEIFQSQPKGRTTRTTTDRTTLLSLLLASEVKNGCREKMITKWSSSFKKHKRHMLSSSFLCILWA